MKLEETYKLQGKDHENYTNIFSNQTVVIVFIIHQILHLKLGLADLFDLIFKGFLQVPVPCYNLVDHLNEHKKNIKMRISTVTVNGFV